ncbi:hypothetical protein V8F33_007663 [Rhypophila sp. PSN 637]
MAPEIKSVAIIGAGAAGAVAAAAFRAENYYDRIKVFERRESAGGSWIYDADPRPHPPLQPGKLAEDVDPPLKIPDLDLRVPKAAPPNQQERYSQTPVYNNLTTNVPHIAMSFSDRTFAYGPFPPHYIPRQYIEDYFSHHETDRFLSLNTTVEDVSKIPPTEKGGQQRWKLTLRKYDPLQHIDLWWEESFDAVIIATGHYSVPCIPSVKGLEEYIQKYPGRVIHSKPYRSPHIYTSKRVLVIGNQASGHDISNELVTTAKLPVYQSRRSPGLWDGDSPPPGIEWKPVVEEYIPSTGRILFSDGTYLDDVDTVIYCTGYQVSFPFWNAAHNGQELWDPKDKKLIKGYWHTFFQDFKNLAIIGLPRTLTFRSFEYQAIALARLWSGRNKVDLPPLEQQEKWERDRLESKKREGKRFHDIPWDDGETFAWLEGLFEIAGLGTLKGDGMIPPVLGKEVVWAIEHLRKYPRPERGKDGKMAGDVEGADEDKDWVLVERTKKDSLAFI